MNLNYIFRANLVILFVLLAGQSIYGVRIEKEFELKFNTEPQYFVIKGEIHRWGGGKLHIYSNNNLKRSVELLKRGEGPGDYRIIQKIFFQSGRYHFWDRALKRMTVFSGDWRRLDIKKYNMPTISAFIGRVAGKDLFKWNIFISKNHKASIIEAAGVVEGNSRQPVIRFEGEFRKGKGLNHDRPHLLYSLAGSTMYYADNRHYRIFSVNFQDNVPSPALFIKRNIPKAKWREEYGDLQYEIFSRPRSKPLEHYPDYTPPLFVIAADKDLLVAVTNERIGEKKSKLDIFRSGKYLGSVTIPMLFQQHFVFPSFLDFPPDIYISDRSLFTCHYCYEDDQYKIIKWNILL